MDVFKNKFGYRQIPTTVLADFAKSELKRAYTLPSATCALSQATNTKGRSWNGLLEPNMISYFCQTRRQKKALRIFEHLRNKTFKNRRRRYGHDSSESGHTQYAFPKKGNAFLDSFTFQINFIKM